MDETTQTRLETTQTRLTLKQLTLSIKFTPSANQGIFIYGTGRVIRITE